MPSITGGGDALGPTLLGQVTELLVFPGPTVTRAPGRSRARQESQPGRIIPRQEHRIIAGTGQSRPSGGSRVEPSLEHWLKSRHRTGHDADVLFQARKTLVPQDPPGVELDVKKRQTDFVMSGVEMTYVPHMTTSTPLSAWVSECLCYSPKRATHK